MLRSKVTVPKQRKFVWFMVISVRLGQSWKQKLSTPTSYGQLVFIAEGLSMVLLSMSSRFTVKGVVTERDRVQHWKVWMRGRVHLVL